MTAAVPLTIDLPPDTLAELTRFAEDYGVTAEQLAASTLRLTYRPPPAPGATISEEELSRRVALSVEKLRRIPAPPPRPPERSWDSLMAEIAALDREYLAAGGDVEEDDPAEFPASEAEEKRAARPDAPRDLAGAAAAGAAAAGAAAP